MISSTFRFISYFCKFINLPVLQFLIYIASQRKADQAVIEWEEKQKERTKKTNLESKKTAAELSLDLEWGQFPIHKEGGTDRP